MRVARFCGVIIQLVNIISTSSPVAPYWGSMPRLCPRSRFLVDCKRPLSRRSLHKRSPFVRGIPKFISLVMSLTISVEKRLHWEESESITAEKREGSWSNIFVSSITRNWSADRISTVLTARCRATLMAFFRSSMVSSIRTITLGYAGITISRTNLMVMTEKSSHIFVHLKAKSQFTDYAQKKLEIYWVKWPRLTRA